MTDKATVLQASTAKLIDVLTATIDKATAAAGQAADGAVSGIGAVFAQLEQHAPQLVTYLQSLATQLVLFNVVSNALWVVLWATCFIVLYKGTKKWTTKALASGDISHEDTFWLWIFASLPLCGFVFVFAIKLQDTLSWALMPDIMVIQYVAELIKDAR